MHVISDVALGSGGFCWQKNWQNSVLCLVRFMHVWYVVKKWSRIRGIARHKVCMVLPISLLFEQNLPPFRAESAGPYVARKFSWRYLARASKHNASDLQLTSKFGVLRQIWREIARHVGNNVHLSFSNSIK